MLGREFSSVPMRERVSSPRQLKRGLSMRELMPTAFNWKVAGAKPNLFSNFLLGVHTNALRSPKRRY